MEKIAKIYLITNTINGKRYVGFTTSLISRRFTQHCSSAKNRSSNMLICKAIAKYGKDNFTVEEIYSSADINYTFHIVEEELIEELQPEYNMTRGGQGHLGLKWSDERKKKMNKWCLGIKLSEEHKSKIAASLKGRRLLSTDQLEVIKAKNGTPVTIDGKRFPSKNDAALYAIQTYGMSRNTALRHIAKGVRDFGAIKKKYNCKNAYTAKKMNNYTILKDAGG